MTVSTHDADAVVAAFRARFGRSPEVVARAPGRVNLLGAHVDYSEGLVLPAAIDRAVVVAAAPSAGSRLRLAALDLGEEAEVDVDDLGGPRGHWSDVPAGVAWALREAELDAGGMDVAFGGDLPIGAGVSSSAAVEMALLLAWDARHGRATPPTARALLGRRAENGYLGVGSGVMDQYASVHGRAGHALLLDCRTLEHRDVPLPDDLAILVFDSGVRRRLAGSGFDDRREECRRAVELLRRHLPGIATLRDVSVAGLDRLGGVLPPPLDRRARHAVEEIARVAAGADALERGDVADFGALMHASHASSRDLYEVSIPELDLLAEAAWAVPGCHGARLSGGGFGGCVTAIADAAAADEVRERVGDAFANAFGRRPESFPCRVADGASYVAPSGPREG